MRLLWWESATRSSYCCITARLVRVVTLRAVRRFPDGRRRVGAVSQSDDQASPAHPRQPVVVEAKADRVAPEEDAVLVKDRGVHGCRVRSSEPRALGADADLWTTSEQWLAVHGSWLAGWPVGPRISILD